MSFGIVNTINGLAGNITLAGGNVSVAGQSITIATSGAAEVLIDNRVTNVQSQVNTISGSLIKTIKGLSGVVDVSGTNLIVYVSGQTLVISAGPGGGGGPGGGITAISDATDVAFTAPISADFIKYNANTSQWINAPIYRSVGVGMNNGTEVIPTGLLTNYIVMDSAAEIVSWSFVGDVTGYCKLDIYKRNSGVPSTSAYSIVGTENPIYINTFNSSSSVSSWDRNIAENDIIVVNVLNASEVKNATFSMKVKIK